MLMMSQEADFCGDRLRLSAFLRVVGNGMPQRPARFRRRLQVTDNSHESPTCRDTNQKELAIPQSAHSERTIDAHVAEPVYSLIPEDPTLTLETLSPAPRTSNTDGAVSEPPQDVQMMNILPVLEEQKLIMATTSNSRKPRKGSISQGRRRLPVNEITLLRTTSSDGLPQPNDVDDSFTIRAADSDPIEDNSKALSNGSTRDLHAQGKPQSTPKHQWKGRGTMSSPAQVLQGRSWLLRFKRPELAHRQRDLTISLAMQPDGFVGDELRIQVCKDTARSRNARSKRTQNKAVVFNELSLASGRLPTLVLAENDRPSYTENHLTATRSTDNPERATVQNLDQDVSNDSTTRTGYTSPQRVSSTCTTVLPNEVRCSGDAVPKPGSDWSGNGDGKFWANYGSLEHSDGYWPKEGLTHYM